MVLAVKDEEELLSLEAKLIKFGISHKAVREPDYPYNGQLMSIGIEPNYREEIYNIVKSYKLMK